MNDDQLMRIFKLYDSSGDGYISKTEMQKISKAFGEESSLDEIEEVVEMMDADCDGKVSFGEFKALMKEGRYVFLSAIQVKLNIKLKSIPGFLLQTYKQFKLGLQPPISQVKSARCSPPSSLNSSATVCSFGI